MRILFFILINLYFISAQSSTEQEFIIAKNKLLTMQEESVSQVIFYSRNMQLHLYNESKPCVAVIIHGLFQSPKDMQGLINYFYDQGCNVVAPLLVGHWSKDKKAFQNMTFLNWKSQIAEVMSAAKYLGEKIILVGHSTGGLLALQTIINSEDDHISQAILFAPALKLQKLVLMSSQIGSFFNLNQNLLSGRNSEIDQFASEYNFQLRPAIAGVHVQKLIENIFGQNEYTRLLAYKKIQIPLLIISTENDDTIDHSEVLKIKKVNPQFVEVIVYPKNSSLKHDNIQRSIIDVEPGSPKEWINPEYDKLLQRITRFLETK